uniref:Replication protein A 70 kDa DNA-binding subunit B/D first OB fold domain-containing protein n=1 Tax=Lactuca sativa TaxID=4236 RepID=A0A9R1VWA3_LACSA|nr:hypothetical protein LSAT_V11C400195910 [Lactuca sativa]
MTHNSDSEIIIDKLSDIDASKESWNIRVQKQTYKNNSNIVNSLDMILMDQEGTRIHATIKKSIINAFQALLEEGAVRQITNFGMARNEGDYMLVAHKYKINFYKTTKIYVSTPFVDMIDPFNFVSFHDLTARNFDTHVVSTKPMRVIKENARKTRLMSQPQIGNCLFGSRLHINDDMHHIIIFQNLKRRTIVDIDLNVESSINTTQLNTKTVVSKPEDYYLHFQIKNIDDIPDYNEVTKNGDDSDGEPFNYNGCGGVSDVFGKVRVIIRVQDETRSASFVLFDRHVEDLIYHDNQWLMEKISKDQGRQKIPDEFNTMLNRKFISKFNLENNYHAYTVHKMTTNELVVGAVFKHSPTYKENSIHSDGTPINKSIKEKSVSVEGDNINVVDLHAVTPTTTSLKRPIEIVTTTESFKWSSSKDGVAPHTLKIPKMEKLE